MAEDASGVEVLVVGAGPVGLVAAIELARLGRSVRVVDAARGPASSSRALGVHARTQELLDRLGLLDEFRAASTPVGAFTVHASGHRLARLVLDLSPTPTVIGESRFLAQVDTEALLRRALGALGVTPEWGSRVVEVSQSAETVTATLQRADGTTSTVRAPYLIAADGGRSTIRKLVGLPMEGASSETWLVADATVDAGLSSDSIHLVRTPRGTVVAFPFPASGRWRLLDTTETDAIDPERMAQRFGSKLSAGLRRAVRVTDVTWSSEFTIQQRAVPSLRAGRILLAGDAAHVHSPASGQGMNTGIQDAVNLGWKVAASLDGAPDSLLDTYDSERRPVSAELLRSAAVATRLLQARSAGIRIGTRVALPPLRLIPPLQRRVNQRAAQSFSALAVRYRESSIVQPDRDDLHGPRPGERITQYTASDPAGREIRSALRMPGWLLLLRDSRIVAEPGSPRSITLANGWPAGWSGRLTWYLVRPDSVIAARGTESIVPKRAFPWPL